MIDRNRMRALIERTETLACTFAKVETIGVAHG